MAQKNITQTDLANPLGKTTGGAVSHYFTGRAQPTIIQLEAMAKYLGVSISWLMSDTSTKVVVDEELLEYCIVLIEDAKEEKKVNLSAKQTARLSIYLYNMASEKSTEVDDINVGDLLTVFS